MAKVRIYELATELNVKPKDLLDLLTTIGVSNKVPSSSIEDTAARSLRQMIANRSNPQPEPPTAPQASKTATPSAFKNFRSEGRRFGRGPGAPAADGNGSGNNGSANGASNGAAATPERPAATPADAAPSAQAPTSGDAGGNGIQARGPAAPNAPASNAPQSAPSQNAPVPNAPNTPQRGFGGRDGNRSFGRPPARQGGFTPNAPAAPAPGAPAAGTLVAPQANVAPPDAPLAPGMTAASGAAIPVTGTGIGPRGGRFGRDNRGRGGRDFRRGGGRRDEREVGPRFGDKDFKAEAQAPDKQGDKAVLTLPPVVTVAELAAMIDQPVSTLIKRMFMMSIVRSANQQIEADVAGQLVAPYGFTIELEKGRQEMAIEEELEGGEMISVPPVVTIMGHVDHGKTSLLDIIRSANVQRGEAGGITQRIGAYETTHNGENIVFLDTPGHEAFTRMRARGAHVTDIAVLVVAADDGVMPQTREAIDHARAARVPIIVAMNKMDRAEADPNRVKGELAEVGLVPEDYGGDTTIIPVSAKTGQGVQDLLDIILLVAELQELKANATGFAQGTVIEAQQDPQRGPVATVLIHRGTLHQGDHIVVGNVFGRVRAMHDYKGDLVTEAGPKKPVSILGLSAVPFASDTLRAVESSKVAREEAEGFAQEGREATNIARGRTLDEIFAKAQSGTKELNAIVKADVQGSVEAMCGSLEKLAHDEVRVRIISRGAGNVTESDVMLADASDAIIIAFSTGVEGAAQSLADREKIEIRRYNVIYDALNDVKGALEGMLEPVYEERLAGEAEVKALFKSAKAGTIAGCMVTSGKLVSGSALRVWRGAPQPRKVAEGKIDSLRHVKSVVKEMAAGQECGVATESSNDLQVGDILQSIVMEPIKRNIETHRPETAVVAPPVTVKR